MYCGFSPRSAPSQPLLSTPSPGEAYAATPLRVHIPGTRAWPSAATRRFSPPPAPCRCAVAWSLLSLRRPSASLGRCLPVPPQVPPASRGSAVPCDLPHPVHAGRAVRRAAPGGWLTSGRPHPPGDTVLRVVRSGSPWAWYDGLCADRHHVPTAVLADHGQPRTEVLWRSAEVAPPLWGERRGIGVGQGEACHCACSWARVRV